MKYWYSAYYLVKWPFLGRGILAFWAFYYFKHFKHSTQLLLEIFRTIYFFQFYRPPDSLNVICYSKLGETETVGLGPTPEAAQQVSASQLIAAVLSIDLEKKVLENATETLNRNQQQTSSGSVIFYSSNLWDLPVFRFFFTVNYKVCSFMNLLF